jgi:hypothetical protein
MKILQNLKTNRKYLEHAFARGAAVLEVADSVWSLPIAPRVPIEH